MSENSSDVKDKLNKLLLHYKIKRALQIAKSGMKVFAKIKIKEYTKKYALEKKK